MSAFKLSLALLAVTPGLCAGAALAAPIGDERLRPGIYPSAALPDTDFAAPPIDPPVDINWAIGLRGTHISSNEGNSFTLSLRPEVELRSRGTIADSHLRAHVDFARSTHDAITPQQAALSATISSQLSADTHIQARAEFRFDRTLTGTPGLDRQIIRPSDQTTGDLALGLDRRFGPINLGLRGTVSRVGYGPTERRDTGTINNADQSYWKSDANLRLGYQLTPILEAYGEAQLGRYWFDAPTQTTGQRADAETRSVKLGVSGSWNDVLTAHAAVGLGQYARVYGPRSEETTRLYEAGVTYQPNPTLSVTGVVSTTIEPTGPDNGGTMRVVNKGQVSASYALNTSLSVTGDAEVARAHVEDNGEIEDRRAVGLSAEYGLSSKTKLAADYKYAHRDNSATGTFDSHQISLGVTLKR